jgi:hypothetical protein
MVTKRNWFLGFLLACMPFSVSVENLRDAPYVFLTGFSEDELVEMAYLPNQELEKRIGFRGMPTGFIRSRTQKDREAHAIASYLGTRRWGPDVTLAFGYMREYVPWVLGRREADPVDIAANYAGVAEALRLVESEP